jgi:hypothetical protein
VGFAPGGGVDVAARIVASKLSEIWGHQLVVDNRAGAGGTIASEIAAKSAPDGYSLLLCGIWSHGVAPSLYRKLPYDHYKDFAPVSLIGTTPNVLVVNPATSPAKTLEQFITYAQANPARRDFAAADEPSARRADDDGVRYQRRCDGVVWHLRAVGCSERNTGQAQCRRAQGAGFERYAGSAHGAGCRSEALYAGGIRGVHTLGDGEVGEGGEGGGGAAAVAFQ